VLQQSTEVLNTKLNATGIVTHDFSTGAIWYHASVVAGFTANFTNVPTTNNRATVVTIIITQGATAFLPTAIQLNGSAQAISWLGGSAPSGNANKTDFVSFTILRVNSAWIVTGSLSTYG
jgi:microcystin-dependent protein